MGIVAGQAEERMVFKQLLSSLRQCRVSLL